jgi:predicted glycoside hydrolase/deacetylase ChbG (UPF0249 family)
MPKQLIINADDFGLSTSINKGIIEAHQKGIVTSTTLMANMSGFLSAVNLAKENPSLGVGVHINLIRGEPVSPPGKVASLVARDDRFLGNGYRFLSRLYSNGFNDEEIRLEIKSQISKVFDHGITPSHLDSEKNMHSFPPLLVHVCEVAKFFGISKIRLINEPILKEFIFTKQFFKLLLGKYNFRKSASILTKFNMRAPQHFYGILLSGCLRKDSLRIVLQKIEDGITEIMCHPGYVDDELIKFSNKLGGYYINKFREQELAALLDEELKLAIEEMGIRLINYWRF